MRGTMLIFHALQEHSAVRIRTDVLVFLLVLNFY